MKLLKMLFPLVGVLGMVEASSQPIKSPQSILVIGDSLSAEYGLKKGDGWVPLLEKKLKNDNRYQRYTVHNASISGETTVGGLSRIDKLLSTYQPTLVIVELGANDAIRGLPLANMQSNLDKMVKKSLAIKAKVLLVGMEIPPNFGGNYARQFSAVFPQVAKDNAIAHVEFFLRNIADVPDAIKYFQADRVHPNASAQSIMLNNIWLQLEPML